MKKLSKTEVAKLLGERLRPTKKPFTMRAISNWMRFGAMPHFKLGREVSFDAEAVLRWAEHRFGRGQRA